MGILVERPSDVEPALRASDALKDRTPVFLDVRTDPTENVWPMVKAGGHLRNAAGLRGPLIPGPIGPPGAPARRGGAMRPGAGSPAMIGCSFHPAVGPRCCPLTIATQDLAKEFVQQKRIIAVCSKTSPVPCPRSLGFFGRGYNIEKPERGADGRPVARA